MHSQEKKITQKEYESLQTHPNEGNSEALFSLGKYHYEKHSLSYGTEDFYAAKKYLEILAEQNNAEAQFLLGMLYKTKEGSHSKEAIHWFLQAQQNGVKDATDELNQFHYIKEKAENGCAESLFQLGEYYEFQGFYADAAELWEKAAHQGYVLAQNKIYDFHKSNHNYVESEYWEKELAQNDKGKQIDLGIRCFQYKEYDKAIYWLKKAVKQKVVPLGDYYYHSTCQENLKNEIIYLLKKIVEEENNLKALSVLEQENISYIEEYYQYIDRFENLAEKGDSDDYLFIAKWTYQKGSWKKALYWLGKLAETYGDKPIDTQGMCKWKKGIRNNILTSEWEEKWNKKKYIRAIDIIEEIYHFRYDYYLPLSGMPYWEKKLAELGNKEAQYEMASKYYLYEGDYEKTIEWYEKSAKQGYYKAQSKLGLLLYEGTEDHNEAIYWLNQAELQKKDYDEDGNLLLQANPKSFKNLTQESWQIVLRLYEIAAKKGDYLAQLHLGICYNEGLGAKKDLDKALYWLKKSLEYECIETFRYLEETKILKIENPYYEQIRKVEDAQPLKSEFIQEWLSANQELFNALDNPNFEEQFEVFSSSVVEKSQVSYIFFQFYRSFQNLLGVPLEVFRDSLNEYRSIIQGKRLIAYNDCCEKNYLIPKNLEELFEWVIKNQDHPECRIYLSYRDVHQKYGYGETKLYEPDYQELFDFYEIRNKYLYTDEFEAYCKKRAINFLKTQIKLLLKK